MASQSEDPSAASVGSETVKVSIVPASPGQTLTVVAVPNMMLEELTRLPTEAELAAARISLSNPELGLYKATNKCLCEDLCSCTIKVTPEELAWTEFFGLPCGCPGFCDRTRSVVSPADIYKWGSSECRCLGIRLCCWSDAAASTGTSISTAVLPMDNTHTALLRAVMVAKGYVNPYAGKSVLMRQSHGEYDPLEHFCALNCCLGCPCAHDTIDAQVVPHTTSGVPSGLAVFSKQTTACLWSVKKQQAFALEEVSMIHHMKPKVPCAVCRKTCIGSASLLGQDQINKVGVILADRSVAVASFLPSNDDSTMFANSIAATTAYTRTLGNVTAPQQQVNIPVTTVSSCNAQLMITDDKVVLKEKLCCYGCVDLGERDSVVVAPDAHHVTAHSCPCDPRLMEGDSFLLLKTADTSCPVACTCCRECGVLCGFLNVFCLIPNLVCLIPKMLCSILTCHLPKTVYACVEFFTALWLVLTTACKCLCLWSFCCKTNVHVYSGRGGARDVGIHASVSPGFFGVTNSEDVADRLASLIKKARVRRPVVYHDAGAAKAPRVEVSYGVSVVQEGLPVYAPGTTVVPNPLRAVVVAPGVQMPAGMV